LVSVQL